MLKFIFFLVVFFWFVRLLIRVAVRILQGKFFSLYRHSAQQTAHSSSSFSSERAPDEAEYEVLESHLNNKT